ncbi:MAG: hypothetical protein R2699_13750 [Acidimicrobiales bacterium]
MKALAQPVLAHRLIATPEAQLRGTTAADGLAEILAAPPSRPGDALTAAARDPGPMITCAGWIALAGALVMVVAGRVFGVLELYLIAAVLVVLVGALLVWSRPPAPARRRPSRAPLRAHAPAHRAPWS